MKTNITFIALLAALVTLSPTWVLAQQAPQGRKWTAQNQKYVNFNSEGAHFLSRDPKDGPNTITTPLHLAPGKPWEVSFDVQMIPTTGGGMSVHLAQGAIELCWLGAGDFYKHISGFLSTGANNMPFDQPWDDHWHRFSYKSDGKMLSLWHNGTKCGEISLTERPDTLTFESTGMELRVRNIYVGNLAALPPVKTDSSLIHNTQPMTSSSRNVFVSPFSLTPAKDAALQNLNKLIDTHNLLVDEGNRLEGLKSKYFLSYQQCLLAKDMADSSGQEGRYDQALVGVIRYANLYVDTCSQCAVIWNRALRLRTIIEADPLYVPPPHTNNVDITVTVDVDVHAPN